MIGMTKRVMSDIEKHGNLFIAITFSEEEIDRIYKHLDEVIDCKTKPINRKRMHLTLVYIGKDERIEMIIDALDDINVKKFDIELDDINKMPGSTRDLYMYNIKHCDELFKLQEFVEKKLNKIKVSFDKKAKYLPHITVSRKKSSFENIAPNIKLKVEKFELIESVHEKGELLHIKLFTKYLKD